MSDLSCQLSLHCPWLSKTPPIVDLPLHMSAPFTVYYKLHTANARKFVNIHVQGILNYPRTSNCPCALCKLVAFLLGGTGLNSSNQTFEFQNPIVQLPDSTFKNPLLAKLEWKNLNAMAQKLVFIHKVSQS